MPRCDTLYTFDFIRAALPVGTRRVLEIGCGEGEVASLLAAGGIEVVAIDSDEASVAGTRARGVEARHAEWPCFENEGGFDAVLFTRSLHHVHDLEGGVAAAFAALAPGGRVIVEDFAFEEADEPTLAWFRSFAWTLREVGRLERSELVDGLIAAEPPLANWWRAQHDHHLHSAARMAAVLRAHVAELSQAVAAYYFRYLLAVAPAPDVAQAALDHELEMIASGAIRPLGRRWTASL